MKKLLLLCAAALFSLMASAGDGLVAVGANVIILPSSYYDGDIEWKAWTWVYNSGNEYGDWNSWNPNYNIILGEPTEDEAGRQWFELGFDMGPKYDQENGTGDLNFDQFDDEGNFMPILWEEHTAPFSSDEHFKNDAGVQSAWPSYQWTSGSIMADIYVRRIFTTDQLLSGPVYLACGHDDAPAEYYINGELVFERTGFEGEHDHTLDDGTVVTAYDNAWNNGEYILLTDEQKALIKLNGEENVIAFHVHQNWGGAFADCGLYTKIEGGLDMGYTTPWEGKVLFNNTGGYNNDGKSPSNNPRHPWSALYEAQEGDVYTFTMPGSSNVEDLDEKYNEIGYWREQLHFKTPIKIEDGHSYAFSAKLSSDKPFSDVIVKLTDNNDDDIELAYEDVEIEAGEDKEVYIDFSGQDVDNFKIAFDFGGGEEGATVTIKEISLIDEDFEDEEEGTIEKELWVGSLYFNYFDMHKRIVKYWVQATDEDGYPQYDNDGNPVMRAATEEEIEQELYDEEEVVYEQVNAPEIEGRVETLAWTKVDFDDSMWDDQMMPTGSANYMPEQQSIWPSGIGACFGSSNYWIRRNFELDKINDRLSYELNVCHDDVYETYVNGILLQKNVGWTNGKSPVQVHIPARYLNVGKNVIATYIQQNWGGYFYDCGINVTEVNKDECVKLFNDVLAYAENTDTLLTNRMHSDVKAMVDEAKQFFNENENDPVELRAYARELRPKINTIFGYSSDVKTFKETWDICRKMEDKGYWGTALEAATAALDTCATANDLNNYLNPLRNARKATAMERHNEKFVGSVPQAVSMDNVGVTPMEDPELPHYYILNVGAKNFLGGGEAWGTHMAIEYVSHPMLLIQAEKDVLDDDGEPTGDMEAIEGAYFIETFRPNPAGSYGAGDFLGWNGFVDRPMENNTWELIPVEGKENVYNIAQFGQTFGAADTTCYNGTIFEPGGKKLIGLRSGDNSYAPSYYVVDTDMHSPELETNQWMFVTREEMLGLIPTASTDNPVDLSFLIHNPGYDQRWSIDDWIFFASGTGNSSGVWGRGGDHPNFVLESYNSDEFNNYQDLWPEEYDKALPAGVYKLSVQGYYRDGIEGTHVEKVIKNQPIAQRAFIFATPEYTPEGLDLTTCENIPLMPIHIEANKVPGIGYGEAQGMRMPGTYGNQPMSACEQAANEYFQYGLYWNTLFFTISEDDPGHISIGIDKARDENRPEGDWIVMDNWRLEYLGGGEIDPDAIKGIESDEIKKINTASKGIYNMLGQRLQKAQKGVNIVGGKKVAVK